MKKRNLFSAVDIIICVMVLLAAGLFIVSGNENSNGTIAQIKIDSKIYREIDLSEVKSSYDINVYGKLNAVIHVDKGAIYFKESECKDKICINSGKLIKSGDSAVCLPAHISITITGNKGNIDEVVG